MLELLIVVLIIGILAAVALPQYKKAVEKARMTEAVMLVRKIAEMHQMYYMVHGQYLSSSQMDKLDITIPGTKKGSENRILTTYFIYAPNACDSSCSSSERWLAHSWRIRDNKLSADSNNNRIYSIYILKTDPNKIICLCESCSQIQKELCKKLKDNGTL